MQLDKIIKPISSELIRVKNEYAYQLKGRLEPIKAIGSHIAKTRGKLFRPTLLLLSAKLGDSGKIDKAISAGVAVELIHSASLIHDDVIDEAALRRRQRTINSKWGNAISVIAGDYLFAKAFDVVSKLNEPRVLSTFAKTASRMCEGEMTQLANVYNFGISEEEYTGIIKRKSAYLISDCCAVGGMLGNLSDEKIRRLAAYGLNLGIAFQITDDCLDLIGDESRLGKQVWQDMEKGKLTLPIISLLKTADAKNRKKIVELITLGGNTAHRILREEALNSGAIAHSKNRARAYIKLAKQKLEDSESSLKKTFYDIADYVLERKS